MGGWQSREASSKTQALFDDFVGSKVHGTGDNLFWDALFSVKDHDARGFADTFVRRLLESTVSTRNFATMLRVLSTRIVPVVSPSEPKCVTDKRILSIGTQITQRVLSKVFRDKFPDLITLIQDDFDQELPRALVEGLLFYVSLAHLPDPSQNEPILHIENLQLDVLYSIVVFLLSLCSTRLYSNAYYLDVARTDDNAQDSEQQIEKQQIFLSALISTPVALTESFMVSLLRAFYSLAPPQCSMNETLWGSTKVAWSYPGSSYWDIPRNVWNIWHSRAVEMPKLSTAILCLFCVLCFHWPSYDGGSNSFLSALARLKHSDDDDNNSTPTAAADITTTASSLPRTAFEEESSSDEEDIDLSSTPRIGRVVATSSSSDADAVANESASNETNSTDLSPIIDFECVWNASVIWCTDEKSLLFLYALMTRCPAFLPWLSERSDLHRFVLPALKILSSSCRLGLHSEKNNKMVVLGPSSKTGVSSSSSSSSVDSSHVEPDGDPTTSLTSGIHANRTTLALIDFLVVSSVPLLVQKSGGEIVPRFSSASLPIVTNSSLASIWLSECSHCVLKLLWTRSSDYAYILSNLVQVMANVVSSMSIVWMNDMSANSIVQAFVMVGRLLLNISLLPMKSNLASNFDGEISVASIQENTVLSEVTLVLLEILACWSHKMSQYPDKHVTHVGSDHGTLGDNAAAGVGPRPCLAYSLLMHAQSGKFPLNEIVETIEWILSHNDGDDGDEQQPNGTDRFGLSTSVLHSIVDAGYAVMSLMNVCSEGLRTATVSRSGASVLDLEVGVSGGTNVSFSKDDIYSSLLGSVGVWRASYRELSHSSAWWATNTLPFMYVETEESLGYFEPYAWGIAFNSMDGILDWKENMNHIRMFPVSTISE